jgi:hypothetical protein
MAILALDIILAGIHKFGFGLFPRKYKYIMKRHIISIFIIVFVTETTYSHQIKFSNGVYMPIEFLKELKNKKSLLNQTLLQPIKAILIENEMISCEAWGAEMFPIQYKEMNGEIILENIAFNSKYNSMESYKRYHYSIINNNNNMLLLIKMGGKMDSILFNRFIFDSIPIKNPDLVEYQYKLAGNFKLYNAEDSILEKKVSISPSGEVINSKFFQMVELTGTGPSTLTKDEINGLIVANSDESNLGTEKKYFPELGIFMGVRIILPNNSAIDNPILCFKDSEIYIYEQMLLRGHYVLKHLLYKLMPN